MAPVSAVQEMSASSWSRDRRSSERGERLALPANLVGNGPLLASTIDEEHFAFLSLIYIIFFVATLVYVELKYNTRSCSYCLEFISFH